MCFRTILSKEFLEVLSEAIFDGYGWDNLSNQEIEDEIDLVANS